VHISKFELFDEMLFSDWLGQTNKQTLRILISLFEEPIILSFRKGIKTITIGILLTIYVKRLDYFAFVFLFEIIVVFQRMKKYLKKDRSV
jgi:hypothetical protein